MPTPKKKITKKRITELVTEFVANSGRPVKIFKTPAEFEAFVNLYFETTIRPTLTGLILFLGFKGRAQFHEFPKTKKGKIYEASVLWARTRVEQAYEEKLASPAAGGAIFALKNMGWSDKQIMEQQLTITKIERKIVSPPNTDS